MKIFIISAILTFALAYSFPKIEEKFFPAFDNDEVVNVVKKDNFVCWTYNYHKLRESIFRLERAMIEDQKGNDYDVLLLKGSEHNPYQIRSKDNPPDHYYSVNLCVELPSKLPKEKMNIILNFSYMRYFWRNYQPSIIIPIDNSI